MSKSKSNETTVDLHAERDALSMQAKQAKTAEQAYAALDSIGALVEQEQAKGQRDALTTARLRGLLMYVAYSALVKEQGDTPVAPRDLEFADLRGVLSIEAKRAYTAWHGIPAFSTAEQAWNVHQWLQEDSYVRDAHREFVANHAEQAKAWLGRDYANMLGLVTFARRTQELVDGASMMPSSGTPAARRKLLVERAVAKGQREIDVAKTAEETSEDTRNAFRAKLVDPSDGRFVDTVPGLSQIKVAAWSDKELGDLIDALRAVKGRKRDDSAPAPVTPAPVEQVAALAEQASAPVETSAVDVAAITAAVVAALAAQTA